MKTQAPWWIHPPTPLSKASNIYTSADTLRRKRVHAYATRFSFGSRNILPFYDTIPNHITSRQHPWLPPETASLSTCTSQLVSVIHTHTPTPGKAKGKQKFENNFKEMEKPKRPGPQNNFYSEEKHDVEVLIISKTDWLRWEVPKCNIFKKSNNVSIEGVTLVRSEVQRDSRKWLDK